MNKNFAKRIEEYLRSECNDYDLEYYWTWDEDTQNCEVTVMRNKECCSINFRYNEKDNYLKIELSEDSFYRTEEFEPSVKYFWMLISPHLFKN